MQYQCLIINILNIFLKRWCHTVTLACIWRFEVHYWKQ